MASRTINLNERVYDYLVAQSVRDQPVLKALRAETAKLPMSMMQISPEQGQFMALLVQLIGARRTIEVGTFTGYSALVVAQALPANGKVIACDVSETFTAVARRYWARAGMARKIDLRLAPANRPSTSCWRRAKRAASISPSSMPTRETTAPITNAA